jgi:hypothetical protein
MKRPPLESPRFRAGHGGHKAFRWSGSGHRGHGPFIQLPLVYAEAFQSQAFIK